MTLPGLALVLAAAVCHATWNVFVKRLNAGPELIWLFSLVTVVLYAPLAGWILVVARPEFTPLQIVFLIGSAALHLAYFVVLQMGYRRGDLSLVYPIARSTGPVLSVSFAVLVLGEVLTPQMGVGAAVIVFGILMLTGGFRRPSGAVGVSILFGLATGALIGSYTVWDAYSVAVLALPPLLVDYVASVARTLLLLPVARARRGAVSRLWREQRTGVFVIAVFNPLAYILVLYALTFTPVAYVAPLRETSVLLTVLAGSLLLGEGQLARRAGWSAVVLAGIALLLTA